MSKFKEWIIKYSKEILISVIVSLITAGIIKGIDWLKEFAPTAGNSLWSSLSRYFFTSVAKTTDTTLITLLFSLLIGATIAYTMGLVFEGFRMSRKSIKESERIIKEVSETSVRENKPVREDIKKEIVNEAEKTIKDGKKIRKLLIAMVAFFVVYFASMITFDIIPHAMWNDYQRDLIKIAPYIDQHDLDVIKSDWICMQSKEDYDKIYERINQMKEKHNLP